jgi:hypothetical protein
VGVERAGAAKVPAGLDAGHLFAVQADEFGVKIWDEWQIGNGGQFVRRAELELGMDRPAVLAGQRRRAAKPRARPGERQRILVHQDRAVAPRAIAATFPIGEQLDALRQAADDLGLRVGIPHGPAPIRRDHPARRRCPHLARCGPTGCSVAPQLEQLEHDRRRPALPATRTRKLARRLPRVRVIPERNLGMA